MPSHQKQIITYRQTADTRIDFETTLEGKIEFKGTFMLDGILNGDLRGKPYEQTTAVVSSRGKINGNIICTNAVVAGTVLGDIRAQSLELHAGAKVLGDMYYDTLQVDPSAEINGKFIPQESPSKSTDADREKNGANAINLEKAVSKLRW
jgi:cytoskeletal protein CcmA (bactofilin family)